MSAPTPPRDLPGAPPGVVRRVRLGRLKAIGLPALPPCSAPSRRPEPTEQLRWAILASDGGMAVVPQERHP